MMEIGDSLPSKVRAREERVYLSSQRPGMEKISPPFFFRSSTFPMVHHQNDGWVNSYMIEIIQ